MEKTLLEVTDLKKYYPIRAGIFGRIVGYVKAVDGVSFAIDYGKVLGLVGESGCGKTTVAKCILRLVEPTAGSIIFEGKDLAKIKGKELKKQRKYIQAVFQNPFLSLNPRLKVKSIIAEPLTTHMKLTKIEISERVKKLLEIVGLPATIAERYPHELSGGQAQRVAIARAIALNPKLVILDEPTSALDVSVQAQILNLLTELKDRLNLSYMIISHDLSVVRYISDDVAVMYLGKIVEISETEELFKNPIHPYTQALLSAVPEPDPEIKKLRKRIILRGE
ncbi:MAG: peptide ABC transporter substrate-binding protein, partial [Thermoprotei archaeon]